MNRKNIFVVLVLATILLVAVFALERDQSGKSGFADLTSAPADFSGVVQKVMPSLVKIENEGLAEQPGFGGDKGKDIEIARTSEGSGFFIDKSGLILTNYHVVEGAQEINVITKEHKTYKAQLIGADVLTDVALIKIKPDFKVVPLRLGDSSRLKVGQWVIAMGNPLGLDFFTSAGIISGFGPPGPHYVGFYDFIQADLNIEPGNSGGPLLNMKGEVVGINNAYLGPGTQIGFAIPINRAKDVVSQLMTKGSISRGFLGIIGQPLTQGLSERLGVGRVRGALVTEVLSGSPAEAGGLKKEDVVLEVNGQPIDNDKDLEQKVYTSPADKTLNFLIVRDKRRMHLPVKLGALREHTLITQASIKQCGINFQRIPESLGKKLGVEDLNGLLVLRVIPGCPSFEGGLRFGDIVREIEGKKVYNEADFYNTYSRIPEGRQVLLKVIRDGRPMFLTIKQAKEQ